MKFILFKRENNSLIACLSTFGSKIFFVNLLTASRACPRSSGEVAFK